MYKAIMFFVQYVFRKKLTHFFIEGKLPGSLREPAVSVIRERRGIRKFTGKPVGKALLEPLLQEALWGPSGVNRQPWKFVVPLGESCKHLLALSGGVADIIDANLAEENFNQKMRTLIHGYFKELGGATTAVASLYGRPALGDSFLQGLAPVRCWGKSD